MPVKPMDPRDPAFPHGTRVGYHKGCSAKLKHQCPATPSCAEIARRDNKRRRLRRQGALPPVASSRVSSQPLIKHVEDLLTVPNATHSVIAKVSGARYDTIRYSIYKSQTVSLGVYTKVMAVTKEQVAAAVLLDVPPKIIQLICSMRYQGFSLAWQGQRVGCTEHHLSDIVLGVAPRISQQLARNLTALAASVEMEFGPSRGAATWARARGWHALLAYDEEGNLIPGAARTAENEEEQRRKEHRHKVAEMRIRMLEMTLEGKGMKPIAEELGIDERQVYRWREESRLKFLLRGSDVVPMPECLPRLEEVRRAVAHYRSVHPHLDPFETLRSLGMMYGERYDIDPGDRELLPEDMRNKGVRPSRLGKLPGTTTPEPEPVTVPAEPVELDGFDRAA